MTQEDSFRRIVAWLAIVSAVFAIGNFALTGIAGGGDSRYLSDVYAFIETGKEAGSVMRWAWLSDLLGYYLLLVPVAFLLYHWLRSEKPYWMGIVTFFGLGYIFCGIIGAAILARTWPTLLAGFQNAQGVSQEIYRIVFVNTTQAVYGGMWGYLEFLLGGVWWIGVGLILRARRRVLGIVTVILGSITLAAALGEVFTFGVVASVGFMAYLFLAPIWAVWLGVSVLRCDDMRLAAN